MAAATINSARKFAGDEQGAIAILFGLFMMAIMMLMGIAVDFGRAIHADQRLTASMDAAALSAGRALIDGRLNDDEIRQMATTFLEENFKASGGGSATLSGTDISLNRATGAVTINATANVPPTITAIAHFKGFTMPRTSSVMFDQKDIELALALDITGSMRGQKIVDLKEAATALVEDMLRDQGQFNKVRIAIAPYSTAINLGPFAAAASNNRSTDGCVYERTGAEAYTDAKPDAGAYFRAGGAPADIDPTEGRYPYECPDSVIQPLSDDVGVLTGAIGRLSVRGGTGGHFGAAWGWNLVSEKWSKFWPATSAPAPDDINKTTKAIILMSDGTFNTAFANGKSSEQAIALCSAMKGLEADPLKHKVVVYAIGFQAPAASEATLKACASSPDRHYYSANTAASLSQAFLDIGKSLKGLRLTQ